MRHEEIVIVDYGSQYAQLIARRVREAQVFCRIVTPAVKAADLRERNLRGIILSGGPKSVYEPGAPSLDQEILDLGVPVLGVCYGMQLISHLLGAKVQPAAEREFGHRTLTRNGAADDGLFADTSMEQVVWMSHGDQVRSAEGLFEVLAATPTCPYAAVRFHSAGRRLFGLQFHPEVVHSEHGATLLRNFLFRICGVAGDWRMTSFVEDWTTRIRETVGSGRALCGVSGGVDSTVAAVLMHRALGDRLDCVFVDNGLLRENEAQEVIGFFTDNFPMNFKCVDAGARFIAELRGVSDPEEKRKIIGRIFVEVFRSEQQLAREHGAQFLVQGTLYPDVIESQSVFGGPTATIKTHHNVGGLPKDLGFTLIEPLRDLFKDEVRALGHELGIPDHLVWRQPFPGPGLAVRVLGEVTEERLAVLRKADLVVREEVARAGLERQLWQSFAVLLPVQSVGVMGDGRTYENTCAVRAVTSVDAMTAEWARLPYELLATISRRIVNEVRGINRVVYDISSKPPATIEWE
ncbi:MAG: glutamine-hydrolyzing GMP synthase [Planctomycetes bacterium]|nr:glutamine-hydrolyzing GMP synthase [Planctomycetota bacterium]